LLREDIKADYYSFSDQDDIWYKDKLERAIKWLKSIPSDIPALYCSRTQLVDDTGEDLGLSPLYTPTFIPQCAGTEYWWREYDGNQSSGKRNY
jgi:hypothetical protein